MDVSDLALIGAALTTRAFIKGVAGMGLPIAATFIHAMRLHYGARIDQPTFSRIALSLVFRSQSFWCFPGRFPGARQSMHIG